ncbi:MAG: hypothetical protein DRQ55_13110 [Planctomycetota bacterium]|nr:MAG: hypothetical protein DRQ55_13110 [Planctomycetota bacterium]
MPAMTTASACPAVRAPRRPTRPTRASRLALLALPLAALLLPACSGPRSAGSEPRPERIQPVSRAGDGSPSAGLGRDFHAGRRALLAERLGDHGVVVMRGLPETRGYTEFRQDKNFWYLTGVESPNVTLVMDLDTGREILFVPESNSMKESWEGELWDSDDDWIAPLTGIAEVRPNSQLMATLGELLPLRGTAFVSRTPWVTVSGCFDRASPADKAQAKDPLDGRPSREDALAGNLGESFGVKVEDLAPTLGEIRRVKTQIELAALRRAADSGARALREAMASTRPGVGEWEIDALLGFEQQLEGADGMAYHAIVGSGHNACVLHYSASSRAMQDGELLLVDAGPEVDHYTTDITRTWPVNGKFTPAQAAQYDAVLEAQQAAIDAVRPGITMAELGGIANGILIERGYEHMIRHGVCHYVGLEVHDSGSYGKPLEPGVVITVEPGLYDDDTGFGVRIEDVIVVTEDGCEVITRGVPVDRASIEALVGRPGRLQAR